MRTAEEEAREFQKLLLDTMKIVGMGAKYGIEKLEMTVATKANVGEVIGITARFYEDGNASPTIYPEAFYDDYKNGASIEEIAVRALETLKEAHENMPDFDMTSINQENASEHLYLVLLNKEMNADLAEKCPHIELEDLIAVPRWRVYQKDGGVGSILVTHNIQANLLHMTDEEVCNMAKESTFADGFSVRGMSEMMMEMIGGDMPGEFLAEMLPEEEMMYVVTNSNNVNGAVALLDKSTLESVREKIREDSFFVIPSSIHEVLVVPASKVTDPADLKEMCESVNEAEVDLQDRLGDSIYRYDGRKLQICNSLEELQKQLGESEISKVETNHIGRRI